MASIPEDLRYTSDHEWARHDDSVITVGITDHAQAQLGDVVYVELPEPGEEVTAGEPFGSVESTKAVSELFAPLSGKIAEINDGLSDTPEVVNDDPYGEGWMIRITPDDDTDWDGLMDSEAYAAHVEAEEG